MTDPFATLAAPLAAYNRHEARLMAQEILDIDRDLNFSITMVHLLWRVADGRAVPNGTEMRRVASAHARWAKPVCAATARAAASGNGAVCRNAPHEKTPYIARSSLPARSNPMRESVRQFPPVPLWRVAHRPRLRLGKDAHVDDIGQGLAQHRRQIVRRERLGLDRDGRPVLGHWPAPRSSATIRINFHETTFKTKEPLNARAHQDAAKLDDAGVTVIIVERPDVIAKGVKNGYAGCVVIADLQDDGRLAAIDRRPDDIVLQADSVKARRRTNRNAEFSLGDAGKLRDHAGCLAPNFDMARLIGGEFQSEVFGDVHDSLQKAPWLEKPSGSSMRRLSSRIDSHGIRRARLARLR